MEDYARPKFSNRKCSWIRCQHGVRGGYGQGRGAGQGRNRDRGWHELEITHMAWFSARYGRESVNQNLRGMQILVDGLIRVGAFGGRQLQIKAAARTKKRKQKYRLAKGPSRHAEGGLDLQQFRMHLLHLSALRELRECDEHPMEVGQIVEHGGLE